MTTKSPLRRFLDNPSRHWAIIVVILVIGLTTVLPAADELSRSRQNRAKLEESAARMRREVADLEDVRQKAEEGRKRLEELEALSVSVENVPLFRQEIVAWARKSGCQVRRTRPGSPRSRRWDEGDSLFASTAVKRTPTGEKKLDSPYVLQTQPLSVSVAGTLPRVKKLLAQLHSANRLIQFEEFTLAPSRDNPKEVVLDIELLLFDLVKAEVPKS